MYRHCFKHQAATRDRVNRTHKPEAEGAGRYAQGFTWLRRKVWSAAGPYGQGEKKKRALWKDCEFELNIKKAVSIIGRTLKINFNQKHAFFKKPTPYLLSLLWVTTTRVSCQLTAPKLTHPRALEENLVSRLTVLTRYFQLVIFFFIYVM